MAVFQHKTRTIPYTTEGSPFSCDLILLHGTQFTKEYWKLVLEDLHSSPESTGHVVTCEWSAPDLSITELAEDFVHMIKTMGLHQVHLVACDNAVAMAQAATLLDPGLFQKTLFFAQGAPKGAELIRALRAFCPPSFGVESAPGQ